MSGSRIFYAYIVLLAAFIGQVIAQCDGSTAEITGDVGGKIISPNYNIGGEYGKSANCTWEFSPPSDGKEYALRITVEQLRLYVLKGGNKHCLGSYNLTIDNEQTSCDRYVHAPIRHPDGVTPANYFCKSYYSSPACVNISKIQGCETRQQTSYPVTVRYDSNGRKDPEVKSTSMYFKIRYEFIECPKGDSSATISTAQHSTTPSTTEQATIKSHESATFAQTLSLNFEQEMSISSEASLPATNLHSMTTRPEQASTYKSQESVTSASDMEHSTSPETDLLATFQTSTIILSIVVAVLVLIIIAGGVFIWKRILAKKPLTTNKTGQQESPDGIYDNDPSPSNQENRAYEEITDKSEYETVKSANVEEDPYITPNATPTGGEYEVPIQLAPRQYENVA